jgi:predicted protein tyrosine phosphatase
MNKMRMNAMAICHNSFQGPMKRILCLCSGGLLRSPTAAVVLQREFGYNTRSAGVHDFALIELSPELQEWADEIVVMEDFMVQYVTNEKPIIVLDIPDNYEYMNEELQELIKTKYKEILQSGL